MILNIPLEVYAACDPEKIFSDLMHYEGTCYRAQKGRTTSLIHIGEHDYFIKQHDGIALGEVLKNLLRLRMPIWGAKNEWRALQKCEAIGLQAPQWIGHGAQNLQSFVIMSALENTRSLEDVCEDWATNRPDFVFKRKIIQQVALMSARFHDAGMAHRDFYLCHFLLDKNDLETVKLYLIDLHRVKIAKKIADKDRIKDLAALFYSSLNYGFSAKDYFYFIKQYTGLSIRDFINTPLARTIVKKAYQLYIKDYGYAPILPFVKRTLIERLNPVLNVSFQALNIKLDNANKLTLTSLLRVIPNKRWVFSGQWQGKKVAVKIFASSKKYQQELAGIALCEAEKIATPKVLYQGEIQGENLFVLLFEWIDKNTIAIKDLINITAQHHNHQLIQADIHQDNFMQQQEKIITLDAGSIKKTDKNEQYLENFALLLAQFWSLSQEDIQQYYELYCTKRQLSFTQDNLNLLLQQIEKFKQKRKSQKMAKILRTCTDITAFKKWHQTILLRNDASTPLLCFLLQHIEDFYQRKTSYTIVRDTVWFWQTSRAAALWKDAHLQEWLNASVSTKPVAFIEKIKFFKKTAYYISS